MKKLSVMCFMLTLASLAVGGESELERLRGSYNAAVVRATAPLKASYEKELQRLLQRYTQANKINEAAEVMAELQRMNTNSVQSVLKNDDMFFVGPSWYTPLGTKFIFKKNFSGTQQREGGRPVPLKWAKTNDGIEIDTVDYQDKPCKWSFRFVSTDEAYFRGPNDKTEVHLRKGE